MSNDRVTPAPIRATRLEWRCQIVKSVNLHFCRVLGDDAYPVAEPGVSSHMSGDEERAPAAAATLPSLDELPEAQGAGRRSPAPQRPPHARLWLAGILAAAFVGRITGAPF